MLSYGTYKDRAHSFSYLFNKYLSTHYISKTVLGASGTAHEKQPKQLKANYNKAPQRAHKLGSITMQSESQ